MGRALRRFAIPGAVSVVAGLFIVPSPRAVASTPVVQTPVMGPATLNASQLAAWYTARHGGPPNVPTVNNDINEIARIFLDEGKADGVRGDIAFAQSMIETAWLSFPSYG